MSRIANKPVKLAEGVEVTLVGDSVTVKGKLGSLTHNLHTLVGVEHADRTIKVKARDESKKAKALAGTSRELIENMVVGVSQGFERKLEIIGVGYRAQVQGKALNLSLGYSHPVEFSIPEEVRIEMPSQTEIVIKGIDKQKVGQVAADIRAFRRPEPYKGKGIRYANELIRRKEAKKS
ncbi:MAG: 50S ribosomal protein L6 [Gammaproteobacteria bacterium]